MKFLTNTYDPSKPKARMYFCGSYRAFLDPTIFDNEWQHHLDYIAKNIIGRPQATESYTVEDLERWEWLGFIPMKNDGIYIFNGNY